MRKRSSSARSTARLFGNCESPKVYEQLWPGPHVFEVQAVYVGLDWMGQPLEFEPEPVRYEWTIVDNEAPEHDPRLLAARDDDEHRRLLRRQLGRPDRAVRVRARRRVRPSASPASRPSSPTSRSAPHTFTAVATDPSGNSDPTPVEFTWTIVAPSGPPNTPVGTNVVVPLDQPGFAAGAGATASFFEVVTAGHTSLEPLGGAPALPEGYTQARSPGLRLRDDGRVRRARVPLPELRPRRVRDAGGPPALLRGRHLARPHARSRTRSRARSAAEIEDFGLYAIAAASSGSAPNTSILSGPGLPGPEGIPVINADDRDVRVLGRPARRADAVLDQRRAVPVLRVADDVHAPRAGRQRVHGAGDQLARVPGHDAGALRVGDRRRPGHDAAGHRHHGRPGERLVRRPTTSPSSSSRARTTRRRRSSSTSSATSTA